MPRRIWTALVVAALGATGLVLGWELDENGADGGVLASLSVLALAAAALLAASAAGEVPVRATGGLLFVAGVAVFVTHHHVWWWLPPSWETEVSVAAVAVALAGLGVLLLAYGVSLAGLSGALGVLALTCLALTLLPYLGSPDEAVLRTVGTALGAVACTAGVVATADPGRGGRRAAAPVAVGVLAAAAAGYAGYDSSSPYAPPGYQPAVI
ncbi:MAG TPA: hypothetical protein VES42_14265, partial [Pilimelia sp.]|nr:hypothetical protein [Pilimelia sp.]